MPQYNGVWTLEQQAQAQSNQQWVTDPNFKNTTLLLQADNAANGATNNTFLDSSTNSFVVTRNGNTTQGSFTPFSQAPGYWGNYFDGLTNSYLALPSDTAFAFGTGAYTVEGWLYQTARSTNEALFFGANGVSGFLAYITNTGAVNSGSITGSAGDIPLNTWCHVAYVRSSTGTNDTKIYVNGVVKATGTDATNWTSSGDPRIGMLTANTNYAITGYISNFRIVKGTAVYTAAFTPPTTPLTAISGTSVLTCQSNRFLDISSNVFTVTPTGTMSVQAFGPFAPALQWTPDVVGGSGYFDGTGDSLSVPDNAALKPGAGDFTWEAWLYPTTTGGNHFLFSQSGSSLDIYRNSSNKLVIDQAGTANLATSTNTIPLNAWTHYAFTRSGTTTRLFVNGFLDVSGTSSANLTNTNATSIGSSWPGYISSHRLVKGTAVYTANFTPPTAPLTAITNTSLLLNSTNAGIYDGKMANNLETVGNAQVATSPVKYGSGSMYFDGTGDYLVMPQSPTLSVGSGNFTYEMWLFPTDITDTCIFDTRTTNNTTTGFAFLINGSSFLAVYTNGTVLTCTTPIASGVWQHVAVVRSNGILYVYLNGVSVGSAAFTNTLSDKTFRLGAYVDNTGNFNGYIDDMRLTNGLARYFTTFTPPQQALPRQ